MNASLNEKLGTVKWGEFKLGDLFEVVSYNSIIAQSEKGIITGFSTEEENGEQKSTNKSISGNLEGDAGGKLLKVFNAELKLDIRGGIGTEKEVHSASREIITKTLHDAAFDIATLQFSVNEVLRQLLPTKERNLCVIHPIAVYYGN